MASELFKFVVFRAPRPDSFERNSDKFIRPPGEAQYQLLSKIELPNGKSAVFVSKELPSTAPKTPSAEKIVVFSNLCEILWPSGSKRDLSAAVELAKNIEILDLETTARLWDQYIWHVLQHNPKVEKYERYIRALEVVRRAHRTELTESECEQILEMRISILSENRRVKGVHAGQPKNWNQSDFNAKLKKRNEAIASLWEIQAARQEINRAFPSIVTFEISKPDKVNQSRSKKDFEKDDDAAMLHPVVSLTEVKLSEKTRAILAKAGLKSSATLEEVNTRLSRLGNRLEIIALPPPPPPREPTVSEYCEFCNVRLGGIADFRRVDQELVRMRRKK